MKKFLILVMVAFLVFGFTSWAMADFTNPYSVGPTTAQFYAVDDLGTSGDGSVKLTNISYTPGYTLQYNSGPGWVNLPAISNFDVNTPGHSQLVQFRLFSDSDTITQATMKFSGQYSTGSSLYNSVILFFNGAEFSFQTPGGTDHVSPVPLPGAIWLLGAGLIGLVGVRRRKFQS